jgi:superfamily II DNA or RNA helicase
MHTIEPEFKDVVFRDLIVTPVSKIDLRPEPFSIFLETPHGYIVPKFWRPELGTYDEPTQETVTMRFRGTLREDLHQPEACSATLASLRETGGGILSLPTGSGKTVCALWLMAELNVKTLIVVHKVFLRDQFLERIQAMIDGCRVTIVDGNSKDFSGDIVIGTIQTLLNMPSVPDTGCVIIDETHHIAAKSFSQLLLKVRTKYVLGLSATPYRGDGLWHVVEYFCGKIVYRKCLPPSGNVSLQVVKYKPKNFKEPYNRRGQLDFAALIKGLVTDPVRNDLIVDIIRRHPKDTLVLTHRREHCFRLKDLLGDSVDTGVYVGGGDGKVPTTNVIVSTYSMTCEGFDCPRLRTLVLATPMSDVVQACGRVMRGGNTGCTIYDIVDETGIGYSQFRKRETYYKTIKKETRENRQSAPGCLFV